MPLFSRRPEVVKATQWNPEAFLAKNVGDCRVRGTSYLEVNRLLGTSGCSKKSPYWDWAVMGVIETISGPHTICPGDYILPEPDGKNFYPCDRYVFEASYDPVIV